MFEPESPSPILSWLSFGVQQVVAPIASMVVGGIVGVFLAEVSTAIGFREFSDVIVGSLPLITGFALGYIVRACFRVPTESGRWVWILPTGLWIWVFLDELFRSPNTLVADLFHPTVPEGGWIVALVTLPTAASICYSIGIAIATRRAKRAVQLAPPPIPSGGF